MPDRGYGATGGRLFTPGYDRAMAAAERAGLARQRAQLLARRAARRSSLVPGTGVNQEYYPHAVTFEPSCGRVLYSTYHTAQKSHAWLVPQERVLLHLIMELGVCNAGPILL